MTVSSPRYTLVFDGARVTSLVNNLVPGANYVGTVSNSPLPGEEDATLIMEEDPTPPKIHQLRCDRRGSIGAASKVLSMTVTAGIGTIVLVDNLTTPNYLYQLQMGFAPDTSGDLLLVASSTTANQAQGKLYKISFFLNVDRSSGVLHLPHFGGTLVPNSVWDDTAYSQDLHQAPKPVVGGYLKKSRFQNTSFAEAFPAIIYEAANHSGGFNLWADGRADYLEKLWEVQVTDHYYTANPNAKLLYPWRRIEIGTMYNGIAASATPSHVLRFNTYAGNWSDDAAQMKKAPFFADPGPLPYPVNPLWENDVRLIYGVPYLALTRVPQLDLNKRVAIPGGVYQGTNYLGYLNNTIDMPLIEAMRVAVNNVFMVTGLQSSEICVYVQNWSPDLHDNNYPQYNIVNPLTGSVLEPWETWPYPQPDLPLAPATQKMAVFMANMRAAGYHTAIHFNVNGCSPNTVRLTYQDPPLNGNYYNPVTSLPVPSNPIWNVPTTGINTIGNHFSQDYARSEGWGGLGDSGGYDPLDKSKAEARPYVPISLGCSTFIQQWLVPRIQTVTSAYSSDGVYVDESIIAWSPNDTNANNPQAFPGARWLDFALLRIALCQNETKVVIGEDPSFATALANQRFSLGHHIGFDPGDLINPGPFDVRLFYKAAGPFVTMMMGDRQRIGSGIGGPGPDYVSAGTPGVPSSVTLQQEMVAYFRNYAASYIHGDIPGVRWDISLPHTPTTPEWPTATHFNRRGIYVTTEKGLYSKVNNPGGARLWTAASADWSQPDTVFVENFQGAPVRRTESWLVKVILLDMWYILFNDAPSLADFQKYTLNQKLRDGTFFDRTAPTGNLYPLTVAPAASPTPVRSRQRVLWDIYNSLGMTDYPFVSFLVRDPVTTGATIDIRNPATKQGY